MAKYSETEKARWKANRKLSTQEVIDLLPESVKEFASVVGCWVWLEFPEKPEKPIITSIKALGFKWNKDRKVWQHPCGKFCKFNDEEDPREKYGELPVEAVA
jgi:hypothetical protein